MKNEYPIIKFPYFIEQSMTIQPPFYKAKPHHPPEPLEPIAPEKNDDYGCLWFILIILVFIVIIFKFHWIAIFVAIILFLISASDIGNNVEEKYKKEYEEYQRKKESFIEDGRRFSEKIQKYRQELLLYEKEKEIVYSPQNVKQYQEAYYYERLNNSPKPLRYINDSDTILGKSEDFFFNKLNQVFPDRIFRSRTIEKTSFLPDIILWDKSLNILIDIEIDEPYILETGEPIHHLESNDYKRDIFFTNQNWFVLRFAEVQIVTETQACIKLECV